MNMTNLIPKCIGNIYFNDYQPIKDLFQSVSLTLKDDIHYYNHREGVIVPKEFLSDELWNAITWIQMKFWDITRNIVADVHKRKDSKTVVTNYFNGNYNFLWDNKPKPPNDISSPPKEAFDLVEGFIFINKNHEIPESIKRMMDEEEAERLLEG